MNSNAFEHFEKCFLLKSSPPLTCLFFKIYLDMGVAVERIEMNIPYLEALMEDPIQNGSLVSIYFVYIILLL